MTTWSKALSAVAVVFATASLHDAGRSSMPGTPADSGAAPLRAPVAVSALWISREDLSRLAMSGPAWAALQATAQSSCGPPVLNDQNSSANVCVLAKALVSARAGDEALRREVAGALQSITSAGRFEGHALALGRELAAYVIAADLIDLQAYDPDLDSRFRQTITELRTTPTTEGPDSLIECHELRPNNWGNHCGASRVAVAAYLGDTVDLARAAQVFKGYLGDRASYAGFRYGSDRSWQCDPANPVGINPKGCTRDGHSIDGVMPDDQRRGGRFRWPPPQENYAYEGLQGALVQAAILRRAGYDTFEWQDRALLRAFQWLHTQAGFPARGDDTWQPHLVNYFYRTHFPAPVPARAGKNVGWTDWTHQG